LSVSNVQGKPGETVEYAVSIDDVSGLQGIQFQVYYDTGLLTFVGHKLGTVLEGFLAFSNAEGTSVNVAVAGTSTLAGNGGATLAYITFRVSGGAEPGRFCQISLDNVVLAVEGGQVECRAGSGYFRVIDGGKGNSWETPAVYVAPTSVPTIGNRKDGGSDRGPEDVGEDFQEGDGSDYSRDRGGTGAYTIVLTTPTWCTAPATPQPTHTPTPIPTSAMTAAPPEGTPTPLLCDLNCDGIVDQKDLVMFFDQYAAARTRN
jgi:hypothetical protein